jgi:hypothetical protein
MCCARQHYSRRAGMGFIQERPSIQKVLDHVPFMLLAGLYRNMCPTLQAALRFILLFAMEQAGL